MNAIKINLINLPESMKYYLKINLINLPGSMKYSRQTGRYIFASELFNSLSYPEDTDH